MHVKPRTPAIMPLSDLELGLTIHGQEPARTLSENRSARNLLIATHEKPGTNPDIGTHKNARLGVPYSDYISQTRKTRPEIARLE